MNQEKFNQYRQLGIGLAALFLAFFTLFHGIAFTRLLIGLVATYFNLVAIFNIVSNLFLKNRATSLSNDMLYLVIGTLIAYFNQQTDLPVAIVIMILGLYQLFQAFIYGVTYYLYRVNKVEKGFRFLVDTIINLVIGLGSLFSPMTDGKLQFTLMGIYFVSFGIYHIREAIFYNKSQERENLKRHVRVSLPIIFAALIPANSLNQFNKFLKGERKDSTFYEEINDQEAPVVLEVLIHTSDRNFFGAVGHVDICYKGQIITYGSYDPFSEKLFGMVGDGVLMKIERDAYIDFCKRESGKTLFVYGLTLNADQVKGVEQRLQEIQDIIYSWEPSEELKEDQHIYPYRLKHELGADIFKFTSSRFKSYFVLSTNCVLLADSIVGQAGTDILDIRGVISPGTYQEYLQDEFQRANSLVVSRSVYQ